MYILQYTQRCIKYSEEDKLMTGWVLKESQATPTPPVAEKLYDLHKAGSEGPVPKLDLHAGSWPLNQWLPYPARKVFFPGAQINIKMVALPRGIMERYLPRNLLVILISWRNVQPFLDSAWCAAAGGWWLTLKRSVVRVKRKEKEKILPINWWSTPQIHTWQFYTHGSGWIPGPPRLKAWGKRRQSGMTGTGISANLTPSEIKPPRSPLLQTGKGSQFRASFTCSQRDRYPFSSNRSSSKVSPRSGLNGLLVRKTVVE